MLNAVYYVSDLSTHFILNSFLAINFQSCISELIQYRIFIIFLVYRVRDKATNSSVTLFGFMPMRVRWIYMYMLQGICETRKYVYFLKLSVNTRIPWFTQEIHVFPENPRK